MGKSPRRLIPKVHTQVPRSLSSQMRALGRRTSRKILSASRPLTKTMQGGFVLAVGQRLGPGWKGKLDAKDMDDRTNHCPTIQVSSLPSSRIPRSLMALPRLFSTKKEYFFQSNSFLYLAASSSSSLDFSSLSFSVLTMSHMLYRTNDPAM